MTYASILRRCALGLAAASFAAAAAHAAEAPQFAWGKAGVAYDEYRAEAYDCALDGLSSSKIDESEPVETLRKATRRMEALDGRMQGIGGAADPTAAGIRHAQDVAAVRASARPEKQVQEVKRIVFSEIQQCMIAQGYTRFALTEEQRAEIAQLEKGSQEWRSALHRLASDPVVLENQQQPLPEG
jgi:hypothetical protein